VATQHAPQDAHQTETARSVGGLDGPEARRRLAEFGPNELPLRTRPPYLRIAGRQFTDPLVALLLAAAGVSFFIGEQLEAAVIAAIVLLNAVLGLVQEVGAERAVLALRTAIRPTASVIRDGQEKEVPAAEIVPGDLVVLREGDRVPADGIVVSAERLAVDESALTGESIPVSKPAESPVFAGTGVTRGRGRALVDSTGSSTELGLIAALSAAARPPLTPLQRQLGLLSRVMVVVGGAVTFLLTFGMLARGEPIEDAFLVGVAVAVAAVPEGLAATVTIALAQGARAMARRGAIVRRLGAVETLGAATVIATDKTGTLTVNQLRVHGVLPEAERSELDVLEAGALASSADLVHGDEGLRVAGDPVDGAFLLELTARGQADPRCRVEHERMLEVPFDPSRRRATTVYRDGDRARVLVKGAPEELVARSTLDEHSRERVLATAAEWGARGLRVLAVAERHLPAEAVSADVELDLELQLIGLVGLSDPLRPNAATSIAAARASGLVVLTLTGDHPVTATAIARELELPYVEPLTGDALDTLEAEDLSSALRRHNVFARVTPEHKLRLVEALQRDGDVVTVTGDGINDTPALRRSDVGVAMGRSGTEAAREAADVILTDDDFATILAAIREGRRIADNIRNFVAFLLSANFGEVVLFATAVLAGLGAPMTVVQVLTVNLLTDGLPAVALTGDPATAGSAAARPRGHGTLFPQQLRLGLAGLGLAVGAAATTAYVAGRTLEPEAAQTMAFATIALAELALVFSVRAGLLPFHRVPRNRILLVAVGLSLVVVGLLVYVPALHDPFDTTSLGPIPAAVVLGLAIAPMLGAEAVKAVRRRGQQRRPVPPRRGTGRRDGDRARPAGAPTDPSVRTLAPRTGSRLRLRSDRHRDPGPALHRRVLRCGRCLALTVVPRKRIGRPPDAADRAAGHGGAIRPLTSQEGDQWHTTPLPRPASPPSASRMPCTPASSRATATRHSPRSPQQ
jgi:P-type Ca2+ transporter type 2C